MKITYIACPYSHPDPAVRAYRVRAANLYAAQLGRQGWACFSPLSHSAPIVEAGGTDDWGYWMTTDLAILTVCSAVHVLCLPGWDTSEGVAAEIAGRKRGADLAYIQPGDIKGLDMSTTERTEPMAQTDMNMPAFPHVGTWAPTGECYHNPCQGMTLLDWFAGQALAGIMANSDPQHRKYTAENHAMYAYAVADAMMVERANYDSSENDTNG